MSNRTNVSLSEWIITFILLLIPIVNIICLIVWALGGGTAPSKKTFAQAQLIFWFVIPVLLILLLAVLSLFGIHVSGLGYSAG